MDGTEAKQEANETEETWIVNGQKFTEKELAQLIDTTSKDLVFRFDFFLPLFFYHVLNLFFGFLVNPIIWLSEKRNSNLLYNCSFWESRE